MQAIFRKKILCLRIFGECCYRIGFSRKPWVTGNWKDAGGIQKHCGTGVHDKDGSVPTMVFNRGFFGIVCNFIQQRKRQPFFFFWYGGMTIDL